MTKDILSKEITPNQYISGVIGPELVMAKLWVAFKCGKGVDLSKDDVITLIGRMLALSDREDSLLSQLHYVKKAAARLEKYEAEAKKLRKELKLKSMELF